MKRTIVLQVRDKVVIKGEEGYIIRIKRLRRTYRSCWPGIQEEYIVVIRMIESRELVFAILVNDKVNRFKPVPYEDVRLKFMYYEDADQMTIEVDSLE